MIIFDWDDTIQKDLKPTGSWDMFVKTLFKPCNNDWVKLIFKNNDKKIITTRSKLHTLAIRLKCFLITFDIGAFSDEKVTTTNPYFFFNQNCMRRFGKDSNEHLEKIKDMKISLCKIQDLYISGKEYESYQYIDLDLYPHKEKEKTNGPPQRKTG